MTESPEDFGPRLDSTDIATISETMRVLGVDRDQPEIVVPGLLWDKARSLVEAELSPADVERLAIYCRQKADDPPALFGRLLTNPDRRTRILRDFHPAPQNMDAACDVALTDRNREEQDAKVYAQDIERDGLAARAEIHATVDTLNAEFWGADPPLTERVPPVDVLAGAMGGGLFSAVRVVERYRPHLLAAIDGGEVELSDSDWFDMARVTRALRKCLLEGES